MADSKVDYGNTSLGAREIDAGSKVTLPDGREGHVMFKHAELPRVVYVQVVEEFWMSLDELGSA